MIPVGPVQALVFGEEPSNTTYLPDRRLFLRWYAADSEQDVLAGLDMALAAPEREEGPVWVVPGPAVLFDSASAGSRIEPRNRLRIDLAPGAYRTRIAYLDVDDSTQVVAIQLVRDQDFDGCSGFGAGWGRPGTVAPMGVVSRVSACARPARPGPASR